MAGCSIDTDIQSSSEIFSEVGEHPNHLIKYNFHTSVWCIIQLDINIINAERH